MGNQIFLTVLSLSLSGTLIGILILCIRPLTRRYFSKRWNYYVWLVVVARLILPISLGVNLIGSLFIMGNEWNHARAESVLWEEVPGGETLPAKEGLSGEGNTPVDEMPEPAAGVGSLETEQQSENEKQMIGNGENQQALPQNRVRFSANGQSVLSNLWIIWLLGVVLSVCIKGNDYKNFFAYVKTDRREITDGEIRRLVDELSGRLGIKKTVQVYESPLISGPVLVGFQHPCMILPEGIMEQHDIALILHHELIHYKRKDLWYKWLYQAVLCIHWFNPLLYLIGQKINMDCELACDEAVMGSLTVEGRKAYGNVLLDAAEYKLKFRKSVLTTMLLEDKGTLKKRLNAILHYKKTKSILAVFSVGLLGVIVVMAGFAGAKSSGNYSSHSSINMPMTGSYISAWDSLAEGYTSLWDTFWGAMDTFWEGVGEMQESFGETFSDAVSDAGMSVENVIWGNSDSEEFLSLNGNFDTHGEAWKLYDDEEAIAGEDVYDCWMAHHYQGGGERIKCEGLILNGSDTCEIVYVKKPFTQTVNIEAELKSGRLKLIHVGEDGTVTQYAELEEGESLNESFEIPLTEGRNTIKFVGQGAKVRNLSLKYEDLNNGNILKLFRSEDEENAEKICDDFREGNIDVDRLMDTLPYMSESDICECAKILFGSGENPTIDQICNLIIYGNASIGKELANAVEKGTMRPLTGEEITEDLIYYIDSADTLKLVENMDGTMDFDILKKLLTYLDTTDRKKCLDIYLGQGNELTYEELLEINI